jgi:manganese/zinc/iron transport system permease protein
LRARWKLPDSAEDVADGGRHQSQCPAGDRAAIGIAFSCFFALGVLLISQYASQVDLDADCVLYGEINFVPLFPPMEVFGVSLGPRPVAFMGFIFLGVVALITLFYHELLISSFDAGLASSLGLNARVIHYALMCLLSAVVVSSFEAVGAILVIAMLILPGAAAYLLSKRLPVMMALTLVSSALSSVLGMHAGIWLNCSTASAMVLVSALIFVLVWMLNPEQGLLWSRLHRLRKPEPEPPPSCNPV